MHSHAAVSAFPTDAFGTSDTNEATNPDTPQVIHLFINHFSFILLFIVLILIV